MSNESLIPVKVDAVEVENGVKIKERKKRKGFLIKKRRGKRIISLLVLCLLVFGVYKAYPKINEWVSSLPNNAGEENENNDTGEQNNEQNNNSGNENQGATSNGTENNNDSTNDDATQNQPSTDEGEPNENEGTSNDSESPIFEIINTSSPEILISNESQVRLDLQNGLFERVNIEEIYEEYGTSAPVVLITHSNASESFSNGEGYSVSDSFYSTENNVSTLGAAISEVLNLYGINTIHLSEIYSDGALFGSQAEYKEALEGVLSENPSIQYVFNISRDILINDDLSMLKPTFSYDESSIAQIKLIIGTGGDEITSMQEKNLNFTYDFSSFANEECGAFVRELCISRFELCQNYAPVCVEAEIGAYSSSYEEAYSSALLFANLLVDFILE